MVDTDRLITVTFHLFPIMTSCVLNPVAVMLPRFTLEHLLTFDLVWCVRYNGRLAREHTLFPYSRADHHTVSPNGSFTVDIPQHAQQHGLLIHPSTDTSLPWCWRHAFPCITGGLPPTPF